MKPVYKNGRSFYRMLKPVGSFSGRDYRHYALWQPVRPILGGLFYLCIFSREPFLLDMDGFEPISNKVSPTR